MAVVKLRTHLALCAVAVLLVCFETAGQCSGNYVAAVYEHVTRSAVLPNVSHAHAGRIMNENIDVYEKQMAIAAGKVGWAISDLILAS